ncbi:hypothetical protein CN172_25255 [Sinorhizobium meliloti]|nr:hypothetical protein CN232_04600 [Sinorhizobium meliloti]RVH45277.1 hypothetical protein CN208_10365 [Sinorhizobium meliloti]RVK08360.1 hypothetical protein CN172_25255 [Sinorhizobium meliloti]
MVHDGSGRPNITNVIDSKGLERDAGGKTAPVSEDCNLSSCLISVLVMRAAPRLRRGKRSFSPRTWSGWIPGRAQG